MMHLQLLVFAVFASSVYCAPMKKDQVSGCEDYATYQRTLEYEEQQERKHVLLKLFGPLVVFMVVVVLYSYCLKWYHNWVLNTTCAQITTAPNTTAKEVYSKLRRKWQVLERVKKYHIKNRVIRLEWCRNDLNWVPTKKLLNDVDYYNEQCFTHYFPTKDYQGVAKNSDSVDLSMLFEKECAMIETYTKAVREIQRIFPRK